MTNVARLQTVADLSASVTAQGVSSLVPAGVVMAYAGATAPTGWLLCDGSAISRVTYAGLFAAIGTAHGYGDNQANGTFNLPNYAGQFLRGRANSSANDPDRASRTAAATGGNTGDAVGSVQAGETLSHRHDVRLTQSTATGSAYALNMFAPNTIVTSANSYNSSGTLMYPSDSQNGTFTGGNETRPRNAYVNYIIKI